jgi:VRR-NUC domain.
MREEDLDAAILDLLKRAREPKWLTYHTNRSDRSEAGFPDRIFLRPTRMVVAELKREDKKAKPSAAQLEWLHTFNEFAGWVGTQTDGVCPVEVYLWRPSHLNSGAIARVLLP